MMRYKNETLLWDIFFRFEAENHHKLFLKNLTYCTSEFDVIKVLENIAKNAVHSVKILEDQTNGLSVGFCCVSFHSRTFLEQIINYFADHNQDVSNESACCEWMPVPIPFTRQEFKKLLEEAHEQGRLRIQQDYDIAHSNETSDEYDDKWFDSSECEENDTSLSETQRYFQNHVPQQWMPHIHPCHQYATSQNSRSWPPPFPIHPALFRTPPPNFLFSIPPPLTNAMTPENKIDENLEKVIDTNKRIASRAIRSATELRLSRSFQEATRVLRNAITQIKESKVPRDENYKTLLWTLKDTLFSIREGLLNYPKHLERKTSEVVKDHRKADNHKSQEGPGNGCRAGGKVKRVPARKRLYASDND